jgi:hypothetical protein
MINSLYDMSLKARQAIMRTGGFSSEDARAIVAFFEAFDKAFADERADYIAKEAKR